MKPNLTEEIDVKGLEFAVDGRVVTVKGTKGELAKTYPFPKLKMTKKEGKIVMQAAKATRREKTQLFTLKALIKTQLKGVSEGYVYKLKICSGHFPMTVTVKDNVFEIKNFIGEKVPRRLKLKQGVAVKVDGEIIDVTGIDKQLVSQTAADIEMLTRRPGFDRRIFQDGIFIIEKDSKKIK